MSKQVNLKNDKALLAEQAYSKALVMSSTMVAVRSVCLLL